MDVYIYQAALLCEHCAATQRAVLASRGECPNNPDQELTYDSDNWPKGPYSDGCGEADSPQHCDHCSTFLKNPLTSDGRDYVQAQMDNHKPSKVLQTWSAFYGISATPIEES